ncbi:hypothetical protein [Alcaligenes endophyticus]|uniref:Uncharacterized protein n=1 Tax=Alcaligenes endophyticus TaxID=1929088 RepID=A0ABT8EK72_9BURK|nr:hypothetical protein [Alcaligenes endophyticus]MCX5592009.1 hypothetical protein [Alcaligenes endophyticus]MDN4121699.1 hypothetical protein [Alcaligenes endophyticus]
MIESILSAIWPYVIGALALIVGWFTAKQSGKSEARKEAELKQAKADIAAMEIARDAVERIDRLDDDAVRDRARKRMRDAGKQ